MHQQTYIRWPLQLLLLQLRHMHPIRSTQRSKIHILYITPLEVGGWTPTTEKIARNVVAHAHSHHHKQQQNMTDATPTSKYISSSRQNDPHEECRCDAKQGCISYEGWRSSDIDTFHKLVGMGVCNKFGYSVAAATATTTMHEII